MSKKKDDGNELETGSSKKSETEQLYDDMTKPAEVGEKEEQIEQGDEAQDEPILTEEELEIQREIESYQSKIGKLEKRLTSYEAEHIDAMKRDQMEKAYYSDEQIERYIGLIKGNDKESIAKSVSKLEIPPANDNFADPGAFNGRAAKPKPVDLEELGRKAFDRVKHKLFPGKYKRRR